MNIRSNNLYLLFIITALLVVPLEARIGTSGTDERRNLGNNSYNGYYNGGNGYGYYGQKQRGKYVYNGSAQSYYVTYYPRNRQYNSNRRFYYPNGNRNRNGDDNYGYNDDNTASTTYYDNDDDGNNNGDDGNETVYSDDWKGTITKYEKEAEKSIRKWYETSPNDWTTGQWLWFGGAMFGLLGFVLCAFNCCRCCSNNSKDVGRSGRGVEYDHDDYTSIDSRKSSFLSKDGSESTDFDDNATYDSIMRLRSD